MTLTENLLRATLLSLKRDYERGDTKTSSKRFVGIRADGWSGPPRLIVGGEEFAVCECSSPLAVRAAMDEQAEDGLRVVVVTPCKPDDLGRDVEARVVGNRFRTADAWQAVADRFGAHRIAPTVPRQPWLRDLLLATPDHELPPLTTSNVLDLETVQSVVFARLGLLDSSVGTHRLDLASMLRWAESAAAERVALLELEPRETVLAWVDDQLGKAGAALWACVQAGHGARAKALGLVLRVLVAVSRQPDEREVLVRAETRFENYVGGVRFELSRLEGWATAAEEALRADLTSRRFGLWQTTLDEADRMAEQLGVSAHAVCSDCLSLGLRQREQRLAAAIEALRGTRKGDLGAVEGAAQSVLQHALAPELRQGRLDAVRMAVRLVRWLQAPAATRAGEFRERALAYGREDSFVDWARELLDYPEVLQPVFKRLWAAVHERREVANRQFAEASVGQFAAPSQDPELVPLELVLERVVAPLAKQVPVLLLVLDGMSLAVFHELAEGLTQWDEIGPQLGDAEFGVRRYGIAPLPTVTEVGRASLLCGGITRGDASVERAGFAAHSATQHGTQKPRLFHKDMLSGERVGLEREVVDAIADPRAPRVVGVVVNAIDDWLAKGDQDAAPWSVDRIKPLPELLQCAAAAGRAVVITSDHGHVREHATRAFKGAEGSRYRRGTAAGEGELVVRGARVGVEGQQVVVPWTEAVRYTTAKQHGYHGGISPQEVLVPLSVFVRPGTAVAGFAEVLPTKPVWWEASDVVADRIVGATKVREPARKPNTAGVKTGVLPFGGARSKHQDIAVRLLQSEIYTAQAQIVGKMRIEDARVVALLGAMAEHGGSMTMVALATKLALPPSRVQGYVTSLRRLLNLDGVEVIEHDPASNTLRVDWDRLRLQFDLDDKATR